MSQACLLDEDVKALAALNNLASQTLDSKGEGLETTVTVKRKNAIFIARWTPDGYVEIEVRGTQPDVPVQP